MLKTRLNVDDKSFSITSSSMNLMISQGVHVVTSVNLCANTEHA